MKRRTTLSIALVLSVISLALMNSDSAARAQRQNRFTADTGVIMLGPNQILRIIVALGDTGTHEVRVRFRSLAYTPSACNGGVCGHVVASENTSAPVMLGTGEAASFDISNTAMGVRGIVLSNSQNARVTALITDTTTGQVTNARELALDD